MSSEILPFRRSLRTESSHCRRCWGRWSRRWFGLWGRTPLEGWFLLGQDPTGCPLRAGASTWSKRLHALQHCDHLWPLLMDYRHRNQTCGSFAVEEWYHMAHVAQGESNVSCWEFVSVITWKFPSCHRYVLQLIKRDSR